MDFTGVIPTRLSKWLYLSVMLAGAVTVFAFAPFNFFPLAWITPGVLFWALTKAQTRKQCIKLAWVYGIGLFGAGASWPFYSLYFFAKAHLALALGSTFLFVLFVAFLSTGLFGWLASFFHKRALYARLLVFFPAAWVLVEWVRTWLFTGFPWLLLGNSQIDWWFASVAPLTGVLGVSYLCVLLSGACLSFYLGNSVHRSVHLEVDPATAHMIGNKAIVEEHFGAFVRVISAIIIIGIVSISFVLLQANWTQPIDKPLTVSVLQSNIPQEVKLDPNSLKPSIKLYREMTEQSRESDLIVWPETALFDSFGQHLDSLIFPLQKSLAGTNKSILIGGFYINENQGVENSVLAISANDRAVYSKRHLVPFGEYTPMLDYLRWLSQWVQLPYDNLTKGTKGDTLKVNGQLAQMTICYEDAFGNEMIGAMPKASLLINVTHDGWFTGSLEPHQHMQIARMRALEMGRYMVRATTTGPAGVIDEKGKVLATAPIYSKNIITHTVQPMQGLTPFSRWGNWLIAAIMAGILLIGFIFRGRE